MTPVIESGVPLAPKKRAARVWPFASMQVGDSFISPQSAPRTNAAAAHYQKRHDGKFAVRTVDGTVRCWRVE